MLGRRIQRTRSGELKLRFPEEERQLLRSLPAQLRALLDEDPDDPALRRLFPPAYTQEMDLEAEYRQLMRDDLKQGRLAALAVMEETVDAQTITDDEAGEWLSAINDLRLVLGTRLDVTEDMASQDIEAMDPDDPHTSMLAVYGYLSWLEEQVVEALASSL